MSAEFASLFELGVAERLQLVEDLWDSIAREETALQPSPEKCEELRRRKEQFLADPASGRTWEQVKQQARAPQIDQVLYTPEAAEDVTAAYR